MKAVAIVCVVGIHSVSPWGMRTDSVGRALSLLAEWAVPAFFFTGGYLRARAEPYPSGEVWRWLRRLLPAYLIASVAALLFRRWVMHESCGIADLPVDLVTGSAWPLYYFVPLFLGALVFSLLLARFPRTVPWLTALSVAALVWTRIGAPNDPLGRMYGVAGVLRSPLFWWGYFIAGWFVRLRIAGCYPRRSILVVSAAAAAAGLLLQLTDPPGYASGATRVTTALGISMALLLVSERPVGTVGWMLNRYSYEIYLFHFFAIAGLWDHVGRGPFAALALWAAALGTGLALGIPIGRTMDNSGGPGSRGAPSAT